MMQTNEKISAQNFYKAAQECIKRQDFDKALANLEKSIDTEPTAEALHDKGVIHYMRRDLDAAVETLRKAVKLRPDYAQAYANLARITFEQDEVAFALEYSILAVRNDPDNKRYKDDFLQLLRGMNFKIFVPELKPQILTCLKTEHIDHETVARAWFSLLWLDPDLKAIPKLAQCGDYKTFKAAFDGLDDDSAFYDEYFLMGLRRLTIIDLSFERLLTHLRHRILENTETKHIPLAAALAQYCFQTEFVFGLTENERQAVETLRTEIGRSENPAPASVAILGCYLPLCRISGSDGIREKVQGLDELITKQIEEPLTEDMLKRNIVAFTKIEDKTSRDVQAQYEEFPYPRWRTIGFDYRPPFEFEGSTKKILNAGCGTGKEPLSLARSFPESKVTAIDISKTSLAYAIRKSHELEITNVTFGQGDILALGELGEQYDIISSSGVLHHMKQPLKGWRVLVDILRPGGYMHIGLYSRTARRYINQARDFIGKNGYKNDVEDIRRFRSDAPYKMDKEVYNHLIKLGDFYTLSDCRDLLFHVMEHQFDLAEIKGHLNAFGLEPVTFILPPPDRETYLSDYPEDPEIRNIDNLIALEKDYPDTFASMYDFWCRKV